MSKLCKLVIKSNGLRSTIRFLAALITRSFFKGGLISEGILLFRQNPQKSAKSIPTTIR